MSLGVELRALLNELSQEASSSHDEESCRGLMMRVEAWRQTVNAASAGGRPVFTSTDFEVAGERLVRFAGRLTAASAAFPSPAGIFQAKAWQLRLAAAVMVAGICAMALKVGGLPPATVLAFCRCVKLLLGPGKLFLDHIAADGSVAAAGLLPAATQHLEAQLRVMESLLCCVGRSDLSVHAEWTARLAPPPELVAWLESAVAAAVAGLSSAASPQSAGARLSKATTVLASVAFLLFGAEPINTYTAAIALNDSLQANLVTLLVPAIHQAAVVLALPPERRSQWGWCTWRCATDIAATLSSLELAGALDAHLCPPKRPCHDGSSTGTPSSNAQRLLATACHLMAHVPLDTAGETPSSVGRVVYSFADLLSRVCTRFQAALLAAFREPMQRRRLMQQLAQVVSRLPVILQLLMDGAPLHHDTLCLAAVNTGWRRAVSLFQYLVALSAPSPAGWSIIVSSSWSELPAWCTACTALLRGQALAAELAGQFESRTREHKALSSLEADLRTNPRLTVLPASFAEQQYRSESDAPLSSATVEAAETALWDLHTALCRSAHQQPACSVDQTWFCNLDSTNQTLLNAWRLRQCEQWDVSRPFGRHCAAMAAAHCQMLQAVVCDAGRSEVVLQQALPLKRTLFCGNLACAIAVCGAMCPAVLVLHPALVDLQHRALVLVNGELSHECLDMTLCMAQATAASPHVTAHMLASGAMETMLQQLESPQLGIQEAARLGAQDRALAGLLAAAYQALVCTAGNVLAAASSDSAAGATEALQAAQRHVQTVLHGMGMIAADLGTSRDSEACASAAAAAAAARVLREAAQPAAGQLAAALLMLWTRPEQRRQAALELAQASAARSCAYLSCSNVGGGGGPAAGQGVGSKRCSQCHIAHYCGTACSHADWRQGGHGRVCKALAGAWQQ